MKKKLFLVCMSLVWTVALMAQQIAVVSASGTTHVYKTFQAAIEGASAGSVIYLPGGGFPIADDVKITKKLTIIGIGHKIKTENPDGYTTVSGNLFFDQGSDGSALMGCYVTGNVNIASGVDDVLIRCNNINQVNVGGSCSGTNINQNYIRNVTSCNGASVRFTNNVAHSIYQLNDGFISNNIITNACGWGSNSVYHAIRYCDRTSITNNIILYHNPHLGSDCFASGNMCVSNWGDDCINVNAEGFDWKNVFKDYQGISATSNFHFTDNYKQYEGQVGIYHGTFNDAQLAPVPYIVAKSIPEQTDASGKLNIKIRVKAGE